MHIILTASLIIYDFAVKSGLLFVPIQNNYYEIHRLFENLKSHISTFSTSNCVRFKLKINKLKRVG